MNFLYCTILLLFISCNSNIDLNKKWNDAIDFRKKSKLMEAITLFEEIIDSKSDSMIVKAQYQIADIYLNDVNNYVFAIKEFQKVVNNYPDSEHAKKSIFMLGYIHANYIEAYSDGINYYNMFLEKYPSDELVHSVNYELNLLDSLGITEEITNLKN